GAHALRPSGLTQAGGGGDISKSPVALVEIQAAAWLLAGRKPVEAYPAGQEDVRPSVVVEIDNRRAVAGHFQYVFLGSDAPVDVGHGESGRRGDVAKVNLRAGQVQPRLG